MTEPTPKPPRRRWVAMGEVIGLAALVISGLGLWNSWQNGRSGPTEVVERKQSVPLVLRAAAEDEGRTLAISPVDPGHAIESLTVTLPGAAAIEVGSDGRLGAGDVESALNDRKKESRKATARIAVRYVEAGADRRGGGNYVLSYRWEGGGLFGGRSLRLTGLTRA